MATDGATQDATELFERRLGRYCGSDSMGGMTGLSTGTGMSWYGVPAPVDASSSGRQLGRRASLAWSWDDDQFRADTSKCVEGCWGMALLLLSIRASGGHWGLGCAYIDSRSSSTTIGFPLSPSGPMWLRLRGGPGYSGLVSCAYWA